MAYISCPVCGKKINKYGSYYRCSQHGCWKEDYVTGKFVPVNPCDSCEFKKFKHIIPVRIVK